MVPAGILNWIWFVDKARLNEVEWEVLANAEEAVNVVKSRIVKAANVRYVFFIYSTCEISRELKNGPNNGRVVRDENLPVCLQV